jgi:hypothetical protein
MNTAQRQFADIAIQARECARVAFETPFVSILLQVLGCGHSKRALLPSAKKSHLAHLHQDAGHIDIFYRWPHGACPGCNQELVVGHRHRRRVREPHLKFLTQDVDARCPVAL